MVTDRGMPTYEYACPSCGTYDVEQRITERALSACPRCGAEVRRLISRTSFALKGSGWYSDGYGSSSKADKKDASACNGQGPQGGCGGPCSTKSAQA